MHVCILIGFRYLPFNPPPRPYLGHSERVALCGVVGAAHHQRHPRVPAAGDEGRRRGMEGHSLHARPVHARHRHHPHTPAHLDKPPVHLLQPVAHLLFARKGRRATAWCQKVKDLGVFSTEDSLYLGKYWKQIGSNIKIHSGIACCIMFQQCYCSDIVKPYGHVRLSSTINLPVAAVCVHRLAAS